MSSERRSSLYVTHAANSGNVEEGAPNPVSVNRTRDLGFLAVGSPDKRFEKVKDQAYSKNDGHTHLDRDRYV